MSDQVFEDNTRTLELLKDSDGFERLLSGQAPDANFNEFGPFSPQDWSLMEDIFVKGETSVEISQEAQIRIDAALQSTCERHSKLLEKEKKTLAATTLMPLSTLSQFENLMLQRLQWRDVGDLFDRAFSGQDLSATEEVQLLQFGQGAYGV